MEKPIPLQVKNSAIKKKIVVTTFLTRMFFSFWNWILSGEFFSFGCSSDFLGNLSILSPPWIDVGSCRGGAGGSHATEQKRETKGTT